MSKFSSFVITAALLISSLLVPLVFWTLTPNYFASLKTILLLLSALILGIHYFVQPLKSGTLALPQSKLTLPLATFMAVVVLNLLISPEGRPEALAGKGLLLLVLPLISLLILTLNAKVKLRKLLTSSILIVAAVLALHTLLQLTLLSNLTFLPLFMQTKNFTPTGSFLATLTLLLIGVGTALGGLKKASSQLKPLYLLVIFLSAVAGTAIISLMFPGRALALDLIPYRETWAITLDALKSLRSGLFGVGLANYSLLYTIVKPLSLNLTSLWNVLPQSGSSELLTMLSTTGILGFAAFAWLLVSGFRLARGSSLALPFSLSVLALALTPGTIPVYTLFFLLLPLLDHGEPRPVSLNLRARLGIGILGLLLILLGFGFALRPSIAEFYMRRAQLALEKSDGKTVYEQHLKAINWYPNLAVYHLSYADVNLGLASALSQKTDLTETDRSTISTLIQQSIREAKTGVSLRSNYSLAWQTLAKIYRNLINVAEGADKFALEYYGRAVALDPANPLLRVEYGGLFYQLQDYSRAKAEFQTAVQLRPTYANAYYNLSKVQETEGDYQNAYLSMQKVIANLEAESPQYSTALSELEALKAKLPKTVPSPSPSPSAEGELTTPSPLPSPLPGGPLELPAESPAP